MEKIPSMNKIRIEIPKDKITEFCRRNRIRRLALFGSVLRNEARPDSDVDVLVEFTPAEKTFDRFMALADLLEDTLEHPVEVVTTESLSPFIGPHILAEARDVLRAA